MSMEAKELIKFLGKFDQHPFLVKTGENVCQIGTGKPEFTVIFYEIPPVKALMTSTSVALGEAYMDQRLEIEGDLYQALDLFMGQMAKFATDHSALKKLLHTSKSKRNQQKEVSSHYDIGNDFYKLWLDESLSYSCGYFQSPQDSLCQAQRQKVERILQKLYLSPDMTLCDIGCGWGFLLIEAAKKYGVRGVGITLSREQQKKFQERIMEENLQEQLEVRLMDYRDLPQSDLRFDRVVKIGRAHV